MKTCKVCEVEKDDVCFYKYRHKCKNCYLGERRLFDKNNREKHAQTDKEYYEANRTEILAKNKTYRESRKEELKAYRAGRKEITSKVKSTYYDNNKDKLRVKSNKYAKLARLNNPSLKLRDSISQMIYKMLKQNESSKNGYSMINYVPWTLDELKEHIEKLFSAPENLDNNGKVWMTWANQGVYRKKIWVDNNSATWKWQLDHITPHCSFEYKSMDEQSFRECWSLKNLRPLCAKKNLRDGAKGFGFNQRKKTK